MLKTSQLGTVPKRRLASPRPPAPQSGERPVPRAVNAGSLLAGFGQAGYLGPAIVHDLNEREQLVLVRWESAGQPRLSWARPAMGPSAQLRHGDTALVLSQNLEDFFIIGVLAQAAPSHPPTTLQLPSGASVVADQANGEETIQMRSKQGALVLEYHPQTGKTVVNVPQGDLEFVTQNGGISLHSAQTISLVAHRLETRAATVISHAGNVYETVEELAQLQAGRQRTLIQGSCHLKARDAFMKAEKDFKVDGEQIHLG